MEDLIFLGWQYTSINLPIQHKPIKILAAFFFCRNWQADSQVHREIQGTQNSQNTFEKELTFLRDSHFWFQNLQYSTEAIETVWYWYKDRYANQWKRIENPEINPNTCGQLIFNEGTKIIQWGEEQAFKQMVLGQLDIHMQKNGGEPYLIPPTKIKSIFVSHISESRNSIQIYKEHLKLINKEANSPTKTGQRIWTFLQGKYKWSIGT